MRILIACLLVAFVVAEQKREAGGGYPSYHGGHPSSGGRSIIGYGYRAPYGYNSRYAGYGQPRHVGVYNVRSYRPVHKREAEPGDVQRSTYGSGYYNQKPYSSYHTAGHYSGPHYGYQASVHHPGHGYSQQASHSYHAPSYSSYH